MWSPTLQALAPNALSQLRARHQRARATSRLRGPVAARGQTLGSNLGRHRPLKSWHAASALALVLVNSCGAWTADVASETSKTGAAERTGAVLSARDPPAESTAGGDAAVPGNGESARDPPAESTAGGDAVVPGNGENDWAPNATVERVVDGDTISVMIGDRLETVRLIGIDTPESVAPTRPVQCFGKEASLHLEAMLPAGTEITLVRDVEARDAYDRLLGYVVRSGDGLFVNLELVAAGYAAVLNYPPNDHYADVLARAEADAVAAGRGLWSACGGPDVPLG